MGNRRLCRKFIANFTLELLAISCGGMKFVWVGGLLFCHCDICPPYCAVAGRNDGSRFWWRNDGDFRFGGAWGGSRVNYDFSGFFFVLLVFLMVFLIFNGGLFDYVYYFRVRLSREVFSATASRTLGK